MAETRKLTLRCPDCASELVVDAATGEILSHRKAKQPLAAARTSTRSSSGPRGRQEQGRGHLPAKWRALKDRDRIMEEKFREAMKRAEEDPGSGTPQRPFDPD
jgi:hypothetical protein